MNLPETLYLKLMRPSKTHSILRVTVFIFFGLIGLSTKSFGQCGSVPGDIDVISYTTVTCNGSVADYIDIAWHRTALSK